MSERKRVVLMSRAAAGVRVLFVEADPEPQPSALIVAAEAFLGTDLPQPEGQWLHALATRRPGRRDGALVFLSDLTAELNEVGLTWGELGVDWATITNLLSDRFALGRIDALRLHGLTTVAAALLSNAPNTRVTVAVPGQEPHAINGPEREQLRTKVAADLRAVGA